MDRKVSICIDFGNTRVKTGMFVNGELLDVRTWQTSELAKIVDYCNKNPDAQIAIGSVNISSEKILASFGPLDPLIVSRHTAMPISLNYETPETLGIDRLLGVIGAQEKFPNTPVLVIDLGTCITYDLLDQHGTYQGGVIAPGLKMRMKAMHAWTKNLPDISEIWTDHESRGLGKSTKSCLVQGSHQAIIHEMDGFIKEIKQEYPEMKALLTGGDAHSFESKLKEPIFADLNLVLRGLDRILTHNEKR